MGARRVEEVVARRAPGPHAGAEPLVSPSRPAPLAELERVLAEEHAAIARFYAGKPERLLGHLSIWDPAIGRLSLVQVLRVGVHHDQHHDEAVRQLLRR